MCQFPTCIFNVYQVGDEFTVVSVLKMSILKRKPKTRCFLFFFFFFFFTGKKAFEKVSKMYINIFYSDEGSYLLFVVTTV